MFDRLIELVRVSNKAASIHIRITYSRVTDWTVMVEDGNSLVVSCQDADQYRVASMAYLALSDYMSTQYWWILTKETD